MQRRGWFVGVLMFGFALYAFATDAPNEEAEPPILEAGDIAPDFEIPAFGKDGKATRLSDHRGKSVLLAFFPKVFSVGCTRQLTEYRNEYDVFREADTEIIAISGDPQTESDRFRAKHDLQFPVVGDSDHRIIDLYGVPGRAYLGTVYAQRCVFLIDPEGVIQFVEMNYSVLRSKDALYEAVIDLAETDSEEESEN